MRTSSDGRSVTRCKWRRDRHQNLRASSDRFDGASQIRRGRHHNKRVPCEDRFGIASDDATVPTTCALHLIAAGSKWRHDRHDTVRVSSDDRLNGAL